MPVPRQDHCGGFQPPGFLHAIAVCYMGFPFYCSLWLSPRISVIKSPFIFEVIDCVCVLDVLEMKINVIDRLELKVERRDEENKRLKDENTDIQKQLCKMAESLKQRTVHHRTTTKTKNAKSNSPVDVFTTSNKPKGQGPQRQRNGDGIERRLLLGRNSCFYITYQSL